MVLFLWNIYYSWILKLLTDGLDGLATVPVILVAGCFLYSYIAGNIVFSEYLQIPYINGVGEVTVFLGAIIWILFGFL